MEPPAKRQRTWRELASPNPTRTIDLQEFQRPQVQRRTAGRVILPREPDVTVTAGVLEVAVNGGSTATEISVPTAEVAVTLTSLGTLTLPGLTTSSSASVGHSSLLTATNSTLASTTDRTVTVTATSTFHVSYTNGTFIAPTTRRTTHTGTASDSDSIITDFTSASYTFGADVSDTYTPVTQATGGYGNGAISATASHASASPSSSSGGGAGASGPVLTPQQTQMVGGIVGGVAGIAFVLVALLYFLRRYRARLKAQGRLPEQLSSNHSSDFGDTGLISASAPMSQSSKSLVFPPAMASSMKRFRAASVMTSTTHTTSTSATDSVKGFQRVSGRKIPSVLATGGDQFGGSYGVFEKAMDVQARPVPPPRPDLCESSFYWDANAADADPGCPASRSAPTTPIYPTIFASRASNTRRPSPAHVTHPRHGGTDDFPSAFCHDAAKPDGVAVFRSSPARTPVTQSPNTSSIKLPIQAPVAMDEDIPEMPLSPTIGPGRGPGVASGPRRPSQLSARSTSNGRFTEQLA